MPQPGRQLHLDPHAAGGEPRATKPACNRVRVDPEGPLERGTVGDVARERVLLPDRLRLATRLHLAWVLASGETRHLDSEAPEGLAQHRLGRATQVTDGGETPALEPLGLTTQEQIDLIAFLEALSGEPLTGPEHVWTEEIPTEYELIENWRDTPN